jgi:hypothetical protein
LIFSHHDQGFGKRWSLPIGIGINRLCILLVKLQNIIISIRFFP